MSSFIAGFRLAWGITMELGADGKYSYEQEQEQINRLKQGGRLLRTELYGEGLSGQSARGIHTTLHAALDKAVSEKPLFRNPADGCRLPPAKAREMQVLTPEEIQRLLIQAKEDGCFELLLLEPSTGLRGGEICALQYSKRRTAWHRSIMRFAFDLKNFFTSPAQIATLDFEGAGPRAPTSSS